MQPGLETEREKGSELGLLADSALPTSDEKTVGLSH